MYKTLPPNGTHPDPYWLLRYSKAACLNFGDKFKFIYFFIFDKRLLCAIKDLKFITPSHISAKKSFKSHLKAAIKRNNLTINNLN